METLTGQSTSTTWAQEQAPGQFEQGNAHSPWLASAAGAAATPAVVTRPPEVYDTPEKIAAHATADYESERYGSDS